MENFNNILLFKTNVTCEREKQELHYILDDHNEIDSWTIDMEDSDRVLRIISTTLSHTQIIELITQRGYVCTELN